MSVDMIQLLPDDDPNRVFALNFNKVFPCYRNASWNMMHDVNGWMNQRPIRDSRQSAELCTAGGFCYSLYTLVLSCSNAHEEEKKYNICIETQSLSVPFGIPLCSRFSCCWKLLSDCRSEAAIIISCAKRYKLAQIDTYSKMISFSLAEWSKPTRTWIQRHRRPWSIRQTFQYQSSSKWKCQKMWKSRRRQPMMTRRRNHRNHDFVSCFRFFSFSSHSQQCWVCSSLTWIHRVSTCFEISFCVDLVGRHSSSALRWLNQLKFHRREAI